MSFKRVRGAARLLLLALCLSASAAGLSQRITLSVTNAPLGKVFDAISKQGRVSVVYRDDMIRNARPVTMDVKNVTVEEALKECLKGQPFTYRINRNMIVIQKPSPSSAQADNPFGDVQGKVLSENGGGVPGATVMVKGTNRGNLTNEKGDVLLENIPTDVTLVVSHVGFETQEIRLNGRTEFTVHLKVRVSEVSGVEINTGMFTRKQESFTGAATTYTGEQLKTIGNKNIIESLKTLDPSFVVVPNNTQGSDPNTLPTIEVRGKTTISNTDLNDQFSSDPNQPLFILDGFESTLQAIYDLDMNRVASITILKDAASTALYGAKASNGVVVVETKRPLPGELRVSYTGDFSFDLPDLSSYNLMNASEKLQFEKLSGMYTTGVYTGANQWLLNQEYNNKLAQIERGVNTYWLSEPVQLGFTDRHSVSMSGGNRDLMFTGGADYSSQNGVMKGSDRDAWGGFVDLSYRKGRVNVTDMLNLSGYTSNNSPYGSFSAFAQANPYYTKRNADGSVPVYLDSTNGQLNPLYNATLYSISQTKYTYFSNSLQGIFTLTPNLRIQAAGLLSQGTNTAVNFTPPENTQYRTILDPHLRGSYTNNNGQSTMYSGNLMVTYATTVRRNQVTVNVRSDISQTKNSSVGFSATGYPYGTDGNPSFAYSYTPYTVPSSSINTGRDVGFLGSVNYAYDQRFLFDGTYRLDGSSVFGSNKLFKPFASAGLGWNIGRESFLRRLGWIQLLKLRGDIGYTGNENLGQFTSVSTYSFQSGSYNPNFGQGLSLESLGNPNLEWQKTLQSSYGLDFTLLRNRISGYFEYFDKATNPLVVTANGALPSSVGLNSGYEINAGKLTTRGVDFNLRVSPIYNLRKRIIWTIGITGEAYKSRYSDFGSRLDALNKQEQQSNGLVRYTDGYSPDDIWAVVSKGIDPATGHELFLKKDGTLTYTYDPNDITRVGNSEPRLEGVINSSLAYKGFTLGVNFRYRIGGDVFNSDLYQKVENISLQGVWQNQDKRALYDRWQKPGDVAQFKSISIQTSTPMSSRFVELDNQVIGESFNLGWRSSNGWIRKLRMQSLSFNLYLNDLFWLETVKTERGTGYPFARSSSFSINASF
ncbi:MAG TPA: SusC/RagA family TonB-linked outer membrane protein [Dinghuibacter sp.]|uniref:SusC/RagA family TonB-linked outer membrane protein n=1 Tax=Dinghuibacter sp. TaxID=2024697 RepID=UPI002D0EC2AD|nr:SusC/RagA family TonB-linked outer membrane protein [Dinghuibacter sp.]HTJ13733.1 SusC/RagA family TonB-linked outer membrane protein [Dinghuibacter sp.]